MLVFLKILRNFYNLHEYFEQYIFTKFIFIIWYVLTSENVFFSYFWEEYLFQ